MLIYSYNQALMNDLQTCGLLINNIDQIGYCECL